MTTVGGIFEAINGIAPFSTQQSYDNSGLLVGGAQAQAQKLLIALDITAPVAAEAVGGGFDLVIAHHPVIFSPLKELDPAHPAVVLARHGIAAICAHTNFDSAKNGMSDAFCKALGLGESSEPLAVEEGRPLGGIIDAACAMQANDLAELLKTRLDARVVRYISGGKPIRKIAFCAGSGGSNFADALAKKCDAFITGDIKHSVFVEAENAGIALFDAGHFHTEFVFCAAMERFLKAAFPTLEIQISQKNRPPECVSFN
ncbi:MAG: Nif3-like dinuclear metal center hexameric protein [Oscillospiraceae bacterium]